VPEDDYDETAERTVVFERTALEAMPPAVGAKMHVLVRMDGANVGQVTRLSGDHAEIGRVAKNAIHLPFEGVSRLHARLVLKQGKYWLGDLASANGTFVQGTRITSHALIGRHHPVRSAHRVPLFGNRPGRREDPPAATSRA
jgi:hypothetical protein